MTSVRPYPFERLPRISWPQVAAGRALRERLPLAPGPEWPAALAALGAPVRLHCESAQAVEAGALAVLAAGTVVRLASVDGRWALVVLEPRLAPRLARLALGLEDDELAAPRPLGLAEQGAIEFLVSAALGPGRLEVVGVIEPGELEALLPWLERERSLVVLAARLSVGTVSGWARLIVPASDCLTAPLRHGDQAIAARGDRLTAVQVVLPIEAGRARIGAEELSGLQPGDVVVLDAAAMPGDRGPVWLLLGRGRLAACLEGQVITVTGPFRIEGGGGGMDEGRGGDEAPAAGRDALVRELGVELVCELGRVAMSGRELLQLIPGAVIPVGRPLGGPVDLTVGGRVVARGELVDVEGELGVRVTGLDP